MEEIIELSNYNIGFARTREILYKWTKSRGILYEIRIGLFQWLYALDKVEKATSRQSLERIIIRYYSKPKHVGFFALQIASETVRHLIQRRLIFFANLPLYSEGERIDYKEFGKEMFETILVTPSEVFENPSESSKNQRISETTKSA